jgi:L-rhamnose isomerase
LQKALLIALLEPSRAKDAEKKLDYTSRLAEQEAAKTLPWGAVWSEWCERHDVPSDFEFMNEIRSYEKRVQFLRS